MTSGNCRGAYLSDRRRARGATPLADASLSLPRPADSGCGADDDAGLGGGGLLTWCAAAEAARAAVPVMLSPAAGRSAGLGGELKTPSVWEGRSLSSVGVS